MERIRPGNGQKQCGKKETGMIDTVRMLADYVRAEIYAYLPEKYQGVECQITEILRNNGVHGTALEFRIPGENVRCSIHMDPYFMEYGYGKTIGQIREDALSDNIYGYNRESGKICLVRILKKREGEWSVSGGRVCKKIYWYILWLHILSKYPLDNKRKFW